MIVTVWRHGEAGQAFNDRRRELTERGTDDIGFACQQFHRACEARQLPHPQLILHSPWVRTTQTAEILDAAFTHAALRAHPALQPGAGTPQVDTLLEQFLLAPQCPEHLVLVSHQPLVSRLVDHYLGERGRVPALSPGGLAVLTLEAATAGGAGLLFWALPPEYEAGI